MKTLAWTMRKLYASINTLDALAFPLCFSAHPVCALLDARKSEVYCALYRPDGKGGFIIELQYSARSPTRLVENITARFSEPVVFCGDGWLTYGNFIKRKLGSMVLEPPSSFHIIRATCIGELARRRFVKGESDDPVSSEPLYLRSSEAEINYPHLAGKSSAKPEII
jgi:tRNA threonylcarbamoyladenosine biosynthesis protein TsaB